MKTIRKALACATEFLASHGLASPREDAELILATLLGKNRTFVLAHPEYVLSPELVSEFDLWLQRRALRYPIQYLRGSQEFFGREFIVSPEVLIPRPETELLVETSLELFARLPAPHQLLDIGTGSGCIAISLLAELTSLFAVATDVSPSALEVARLNARKHKCSDRIQFLLGDLGEPAIQLGQVFDLVVSNPPYIPFSESHQLAQSAVKYEPEGALFAGETGLEVYARLLSTASPLLGPEGYLVLELGYGQSVDVTVMAQRLGWNRIRLSKDLAGIDRCIVLRPS
jgi:release factor glutamine methyltransferase